MWLMGTVIALFKCELTKTDFIEKGGENGGNSKYRFIEYGFALERKYCLFHRHGRLFHYIVKALVK